MLNSYPRIYSLSTIGIIYHFNVDYRFHTFRTDFSGDGGSGKTMVADMIQLILMGPGVYKSSTEANNDRPIDGMVLKSKNNQYAAGYIMLNIEVAPKQFIAIGAFIEKSSKQVKMFVGQAGFNWDQNLTPLSQPIFYKDLLIDNKVVPIEELQSIQSIHIKTFPLKQYHRILYINDILPIELSENKKTLESYASIFRSFSRGSGFKKDSDSLKSFLFGQDEKNFLTKYQTEVKSISDDYQEHDRYKKEIGLINQKQGYIRDIILLEISYKKLKHEYFTRKALYWNQKLANYSLQYEKEKKRFDKARIEQACINKEEERLLLEELKVQVNKYNISKTQLSKILDQKKDIHTKKDEKYSDLQLVETKKKNIKLIESLLKKHDNDLNLAKQYYEKEIAYKQNKKLLNDFTLHLKTNNVIDLFEKSLWLSNFKDTKENYENQSKQRLYKLEEITALLNFADLQNPESLASWALENFNKPLSKQEESILRYFQSFPRTNKNLARYIVSPNELFENLDIKNENTDGFWLNLDGVYEYIKYVQKQFLNIDQKEKTQLKTKLSLISKDLKVEFDDLNNEIKEQDELKRALFDFHNLEHVIILYTKKNEFSRPENSEYSNIEKEEFSKYLDQYANKKEIEKEYQLAKDAYDRIVLLENNIDPDNFQQQYKDSLAYFIEKNINPEESPIYLSNKAIELHQQKSVLTLLQKELQLNDNDFALIETKLFAKSTTYTSILQLKTTHYKSYSESESDFKIISDQLKEAKEKSDAAQLEYQTVFKKPFALKDSTTQASQNPDEGNNNLKEQYEVSKLTFETKYDLIVNETEDGAYLKGTFHTGQLANKLLPTVFITTVLEDETQLETQLANRLTKLYQTIKEIGSRKIEILKRVFTDVNKAYRDYLDKVNKINQYFKNPNKSITGGNKASLKYVPSNDYPAKWMNVFNKMLDDKINYTGLFEQLSEEIDINEMMKKAFINEGGTKDANIEDLLDPKSYFDLTFELKLENGDNNSGSNSQTYSGNALLGLARLSLIEEEKNGIRIMPIDEAQGLGSNYEMLRDIAIEEKYQILTMAIEPAGELNDGEQYIYILSENKLLDENNYVPAMGIFSEGIITPNINDFINAEKN